MCIPSLNRWLLVVAVAVAVCLPTGGCDGCEKDGPFRAVRPEVVDWGDQGQSVTILLGGDTSFGENYGRSIRRMLKNKGYDASFDGLRPLIDAVDVAVLNLETPVTDLKNSPFESTKSYVHWTHPGKAPVSLARQKVRLVSLANNHTLDFGEQGLRQTFEALSKHRIAWVGAGVDKAEAQRPFVAAMRIGGAPFRLGVVAAFEYSTRYDKMYRFYADDERGGVNRLAGKRATARIGGLKADHPETFVLVFPHWGRNYKWRSGRQAKMAGRLLDAGADLVAGHGSHVMQEIDFADGRFVLYSLGNFLFHSQGRYQQKKVKAYSLPLLWTIRRDGDGFAHRFRVYPILSDNRVTKFRPRLLDEDEFEEATAILADKSGPEAARHLMPGSDEIGRYIELVP